MSRDAQHISICSFPKLGSLTLSHSRAPPAARVRMGNLTPKIAKTDARGDKKLCNSRYVQNIVRSPFQQWRVLRDVQYISTCSFPKLGVLTLSHSRAHPASRCVSWGRFSQLDCSAPKWGEVCLTRLRGRSVCKGTCFCQAHENMHRTVPYFLPSPFSQGARKQCTMQTFAHVQTSAPD